MSHYVKSIFGFILFGFLCLPAFFSTAHAESLFLTPEENLWLKLRNNTIVVYPEKNFPPFSYQIHEGTPQGLSIDYIELIADKIGVKIQYLPARSMSQILEDVQIGKGDVVTSLAENEERSQFLLFTEDYISVPAVIVQRKDVAKKTNLTPSDFSGRKVAVGSKYAVETYLKENYPRVVLESVTDDEVALQLLVLGEVDAVVMDVASFSYYLSKQILNSIKIVGNTGFSYNMAFAVPKEKEILQSILEKGLIQISTQDRQLLAEKWVALPGEDNIGGSTIAKVTKNPILFIFYTVLVLGFLIFFVVIFTRHRRAFSYFKNSKTVDNLQGEIAELEDVSKELTQELEQVKEREHQIAEKINDLKD